MLNKENLLTVPFVSGWRKLTVGRYQYSDVHGYGFNSISKPWGKLSDLLLNGKTITAIRSFIFDSSHYTEVIFSNYDSFPERTLYLKRKDKDTISLSYETGEGTKYINYNTCYFTEEDVGKTIDIYIGLTPLPEK